MRSASLRTWSAGVFGSVREVLTAEPRISYALMSGSFARGTQHAQSDLDIAVGGLSKPLSVLELGDLISRLEAAAGRPVDLTAVPVIGARLRERREGWAGVPAQLVAALRRIGRGGAAGAGCFRDGQVTARVPARASSRPLLP